MMIPPKKFPMIIPKDQVTRDALFRIMGIESISCSLDKDTEQITQQWIEYTDGTSSFINKAPFPWEYEAYIERVYDRETHTVIHTTKPYS